MQIKADENGNIIQTADIGEIPGAADIDLSMYKYIDGNLILDTEKLQAQQNAVRAAEIKSRLLQIDCESIRPLRAVAAGTATEFDTQKLAALESEADELREELSELGV